MAENKQPYTGDIEEGSSQGTNATSNEPKLVSDQEKEPITSHIDNFRLVPNLWPSSATQNYCCIYKVPCRLRRVNPEAYTPQMLLIGPLQHFKKAQADELSKTQWRYLEYIKMERHKEKYLENFAHRYGEQTVDEFRRIIERDEGIIRACYAESTDSIKSEDFVEMMLLDSVFILLFFCQAGVPYKEKTGDFVLDEPCHQYTIIEDLLLLENQLPFLLLEKLFDRFSRILGINYGTFRDLILEYFGFKEKIKSEMNFLHFTDLFRRVSVQSLGLTEQHTRTEKITNLHCAERLDSAGVQFVAVKTESESFNNISLAITFKEGILKMPFFEAQDDTERSLRNIMALEQRHYPYTAYVCNYISFLDSLINTVQDVDFLIKKEVISNRLGRSEALADMVNKLCLGIVISGSYYYDIAKGLKEHYDNHINRTVATLQRVYFKDLWTGTAHVAAIVILVLTLIGTVASVLQVKQKDK